MRLKYKILWFEDDEDVLDYGQGPIIKAFLEDLGFEPVIRHETNGENLATIMPTINSYDLIVSDLNLDETSGNDISGNEIIKEIRAGKILTEVLLYSSKSKLLNKTVSARYGWIQRASYCSGRSNLVVRLKEIILLTVKKQQDVNNARGLVIAETIVLEKQVERILQGYFKVTKGAIDAGREALLADIRRRKKEQYEQETSYFTSIESISLEELIEKDILTANNTAVALIDILTVRLKEVNVALNSGKIEKDKRTVLLLEQKELTIIKGEMTNFNKEILLIRNTLAHVEEQAGPDGIPYLISRNKAGTEIRFDSDQYIKIRKDLRKHSSNLEKILEHLAL